MHKHVEVSLCKDRYSTFCHGEYCRKGAESKPAQPTVPKQSILCFSKGKFVGQKPKDPAPATPPWQCYLYPAPKTERLKFFNQVTQEIYESAYVAKQTQFRDYLNGQRQFRWNMMQETEKLESIWQCFEKGIIPKENIQLSRCSSVPEDPNVKDVSHVSRVLKHVTATISMLDKQEKLLRNRLSAIIDKVHLWAKNEHDTIQGYIATTKELHGKVLVLQNNLSYILKTLDKKINKSAIASFEASRKKKRQREQKCKNKKKYKVRFSREDKSSPEMWTLYFSFFFHLCSSGNH